MPQDHIDKLLKVVNRKTDKKLQYQDDILNFLETFGIKRGRNLVKVTTVRKLYKSWTKESIPVTTVISRLNECLGIPGTTTYYKLNLNSLYLNEKLYEPKAEEKNRIPVKQHNTILEFLKYYNIDDGIVWTEVRTLYSLYKKWVEENNIIGNKLSKVKFSKILKLHLRYAISIKNSVVFAINYNLEEVPIDENKEEGKS